MSRVPSPAGARRCRPADAAAVITLLVALAATVVFLVPHGPSGALDTFTPEHFYFLGFVDNLSQRLAHRAALLTLAALCGVGVVFSRFATHSGRLTRTLDSMGRWLRGWSGALLIAAGASVALLNPPGVFYQNRPTGTLGLNFWLASVCLGLSLVRWGWRRGARSIAPAVAVVIAAYAVVLIAPGWIRHPFLPTPLLREAEWHYSATLAQGDRLAAGLQLGSQVSLNYGLIHVLLLAAFERHWGLVDFGGHLRLVQASQVAFLAVAFWAFWLWRPRSPLFLLFAILLIGPWLSTSHVSVFYPNQSGGRALGLAAGVVWLLLMRGRPLPRAAALLGAGAGLLVLYNPETGLCLSLGYGLFILSCARDPSWLGTIRLSLRAVAGALTAAAGVLILYRVALGTWPPLGIGTLLGFSAKFGQGYSSLRLYYDPVALLILLHSTYVVGSSVLTWWTRGLRFEESVRFGIAATILVWGAYYVNRPHAWNLWTYQFLYAFLIADLFDHRVLKWLSLRGTGAMLDWRLAAFASLLMPMLFVMNYSMLTEALRARDAEAAMTLSGISVSAPTARTLQAQAEFLAAQPSALFFSRHPYSLSLLTGRFNPLPVQDVFTETVTHAAFEQLAAEISRMCPDVLLFDEPEPAPSGRPRTAMPRAHDEHLLGEQNFYDRLKARLTGVYQRQTVASGWEVWRAENCRTS